MPPVPAPGVELDHLAIASPGAAIATATHRDTTVDVVTRSIRPAGVASLERATERVSSFTQIEGADGAWASVASGGDLFIGTYLDANIYRIDSSDAGVRHLASLEEDSFVWDLGIDGTELFAGVWPTGRVLVVDSETGETRSLGQAVPGEEYVRAIGVTSETIYAGVGAHARLVAYDRASGDRTQLLPKPLHGESFVNSIAIGTDTVVVGTYPVGTLCVYDRETHALARTVEPVTGSGITGVCIGEADTVYFTSSRAANQTIESVLHRYHPEAEQPHVLGRFEGGYCCALDWWDGRLWGAGTHGFVWSCEGDGSDPVEIELFEAGMANGAERPQSLAIAGTSPVVGSHGYLTLHGRSVSDPRRIPVPGEPKALVITETTAYCAIYPGAHLVEWSPTSGEARLLETIGHLQDRPRAMAFEPRREELWIGTAPEYGHLDGALSRYACTEDRLEVYRGVIPDQSIAAIGTRDGRVYLGSEIRGGFGIAPQAETARFAEWNPRTGEIEWSIPIEDTQAVIDMTVLDGSAMITAGVDESGPAALLEIDLASRSIHRRVSHPEALGSIGRHDGYLYTITESRLIRLDIETWKENTVVEDLDGAWFNRPTMTIATDGTIYTLAGYELVRVVTEHAG